MLPPANRQRCGRADVRDIKQVGTDISAASNDFSRSQSRPELVLRERDSFGVMVFIQTGIKRKLPEWSVTVAAPYLRSHVTMQRVFLKIGRTTLKMIVSAVMIPWIG
jgi:hypothetical protein